MQAHGGMGVCQDTPLPELYAQARMLHLADGPDEVHKMALARRELRRYPTA
jgi:acyl-CoA dehydrogenase